MYKRICVIGLGRFGMGVATELYQAGHDVLVIDRDEEKVQSMLGKATYAITMDATTDQGLSNLGIDEYDAVILALGDSNVEASILVAMVLRDMGISMIIARAATQLHGQALARVGVGKVVYPEEESAKRLAHLEINPDILDYMEVLNNVGISKVRPRPSMVRKTVEEAGLAENRGDNSLTVLGLRRGRRLILNPSRDETIAPGDVLLVAGPSDQVARVFTTNELTHSFAGAEPVS
jgi:trk system potassium uptake protein TrkA